MFGATSKTLMVSSDQRRFTNSNRRKVDGLHLGLRGCVDAFFFWISEIRPLIWRPIDRSPSMHAYPS